MQDEHQIPIWLFIGALLLAYGIIILGTGLVGLAHPSHVQIILKQSNPQASWFFVHADVWWGVLLSFLGAFYCIRFRPRHKSDS
jgi:hypothetical protein